MPQTTHTKRNRLSLDAQIALSARILKGVHQTLDEQIERACELEAEQAVALYRAGKATLQEADDVMKQARQRVG